MSFLSLPLNCAKSCALRIANEICRNKMSASRIISRTLKIAGWTVLGSASLVTGSYLLSTRKTHIVSLPQTHSDPSPYFNVLNPGHPVTADVATRYVELDKFPIDLQDHVRNGDGSELTRRFCAMVFSGRVFDTQRRYLFDKYAHLKGREDQLWTARDLSTSEYKRGTRMVDHFEVLQRSPQEIVIRCGDTPLNNGRRGSDGLFTIRANYRPSENDIEFQLQSIFFNSLHQSTSGPMPEWMELLHRVYTKLLMESAVRAMTSPW